MKNTSPYSGLVQAMSPNLQLPRDCDNNSIFLVRFEYLLLCLQDTMALHDVKLQTG